jgi:hypothetical protein
MKGLLRSLANSFACLLNIFSAVVLVERPPKLKTAFLFFKLLNTSNTCCKSYSLSINFSISDVNNLPNDYPN